MIRLQSAANLILSNGFHSEQIIDVITTNIGLCKEK